MKVLLIGGTGTISTAVTALAAQKGYEVTLLNRGHHNDKLPRGVTAIAGDIHDEEWVNRTFEGTHFDTVANFLDFEPADFERSYRLWKGRTNQYIFISSASAYQTPLASPIVTESTPLANPFWQYSRNKIAGEEFYLGKYRSEGFPITIVRPSHTYGEKSLPLSIEGNYGPYTVLERLRQGKKVIVHGDGSSLWTVTFNTDFAQAFVGLFGNVHAIGEAYHITSDESLTWNQIHEIIGNALGRTTAQVDAQLVHIPSEIIRESAPDIGDGLIGDKSNSLIFDNSKIKKVVPEFSATVRFDQGARRSIEYIYSHPECQKVDEAFNRWSDALIKKYEAATADLPKIADFAE